MTSIAGSGLRGRVAVIAGDGSEIVAICRELLDAGVILLVVAPERQWVNDAVADVSDPALTVVPITADPSSTEVWDRLVPHAEQRLGPIDIAVAVGSVVLRDLAHERLAADMVRRGHGIFIEVGKDAPSRQTPAAIIYACLPRDADDLAARIVAIAQG